jgi:hypothetical protein
LTIGHVAEKLNERASGRAVGKLPKFNEFVIYLSLHPPATYRHSGQAKLFVISSSESLSAEA